MLISTYEYHQMIFWNFPYHALVEKIYKEFQYLKYTINDD